MDYLSNLAILDNISNKKATMQTIAATEIKQRLGQYLDAALSEPVIIMKSGRPSVVLLSLTEYERLQTLEDELWTERANKAMQSGFVGTEKSLQKLQERLDEIAKSDQ